MRRVRVEESDPEIAFDLVECAQQGCEGFALGGIDLAPRIGASVFPSIHPKIGRVLGDEVDLTDARFHEGFGFANHGFLSPGTMAAADLRNDAERTGVIAAFRDLDVCGVGGG